MKQGRFSGGEEGASEEAGLFVVGSFSASSGGVRGAAALFTGAEGGGPNNGTSVARMEGCCGEDKTPCTTGSADPSAAAPTG